MRQKRPWITLLLDQAVSTKAFSSLSLSSVAFVYIRAVCLLTLRSIWEASGDRFKQQFQSLTLANIIQVFATSSGVVTNAATPPEKRRFVYQHTNTNKD